jgi:hypothetical protein
LALRGWSSAATAQGLYSRQHASQTAHWPLAGDQVNRSLRQAIPLIKEKEKIMRVRIKAGIMASALATLIAGPAIAPAIAEDPREKPDNSWISVSGTVDRVMADSFVLDYGDGTMDEDLFEGRELVASSVVTLTGGS